MSNNKDVLTEITIAKGDQHAVDLDFAEIMPASISGHVCLVLPGFDCFSTAPNSKTPLSGVLIDLLDAQGNKIASTTTAADGSYRFEQLPAGVYTVVEHTPPQYIDGAAKVGTIAGSTVGKLDNSNRISQIIVAGGMNGVDYDFCELLPGSLSGHVYEDKNDDGIRSNSEAFIAGVVVRLLDQTGKQVAQTTTDANGYYKFSFLGPGTYCIVEETPNGYIDGKDRAGTILGNGVGQAINPGDKIKDIVLPSGRDGVDYDFGELKQGSISGKVFVDFDGDCYKDPGVDQPISNVLVQLLDAQGKVIQETRTDAQGNYRFDGLRPVCMRFEKSNQLAIYKVVRPSVRVAGTQRSKTIFEILVCKVAIILWTMTSARFLQQISLAGCLSIRTEIAYSNPMKLRSLVCESTCSTVLAIYCKQPIRLRMDRIALPNCHQERIRSKNINLLDTIRVDKKQDRMVVTIV